MVELAEHVVETLDVGAGTRVFEVDCGAGEFLQPLHLNGYIVGGIDADPDAIAKAIAAMPDGIFQLGTPSALDPGVPWDVVICRSFVAPHDMSAVVEADYLRGLLARMFAKATHAIAILEVPDHRRKWMLHALAEIGAQAIQFEDAAPDARPGAGEKFHVFART